MLKIFVGFLAAFGFAVQVFAVDVKIVENDDAEVREQSPYVLSFDGSTELTPQLIKKMVACKKSFKKKEDKESLERLFEQHGNPEDLQPNGHVTLSNRELNESFATGLFKDCLSK